jgi:hypothetical protein
LKTGYRKLKEYFDGIKTAQEILEISSESGDFEILKEVRGQMYEGVRFGEDYL